MRTIAFPIKALLLLFVLTISVNCFAQQNDNWQKEVSGHLSLIEKERKNGITDTSSYLSALYELSILYYEKGQWDEVVVLSLEADSLFRQYFSSITGLHISLLARLANAFSKQKEYYRAASAQLEMISLEEFLFSKGRVETIDGLKIPLQTIVDDYRVFASFTRYVPDHETTKQALKYAIKLMEENNIVDSCEYAWNIYGQLFGEYYEDPDSIDLAIYYKEKECSVFERWYGKNSKQYREEVLILEGLYNRVGLKQKELRNYNDALKAFLVCDSIFNAIGDDTSKYFFANVLNMADCLIGLGNIARALTITEEAEPDIKKNCGKESGLYKWAVKLLPYLYIDVNDYEKQITFLNKSIAIDSRDSNYNAQAESLHNIARVYEQKGLLDSAETYYYKSISVLKQCLSDTSLELTMPYSRLLIIYARLGDQEKYDSIIDRCNRIFECNANHPECNEYNLNASLTIAEIASFKRWKEAEAFWQRAVYLLIKNGETENMNYLYALVKYVAESFINGHYPDPKQVFQQALIDNCIFQYATNHSLLSSNERESIINSPLYLLIRDIVFSLTCDSSNYNSLYDYILFCKQQGLTTDIEFSRAAIKNSDNPFTSDVDDTNASHTLNERKSRIAATTQGSNEWMDASYDSIRQSLRSGDLAIEFIRYYDCSNFATDHQSTEKYIALIARKDWDEPRYIPLCKADDLKKYTSLTSEKIYGGGYVSEEIVRLLFDPIKEYTKKGGHVYFAPDGVLYNLAIENILTDGGMTLGEKYGLVRCSSTRNIAQIDNQPQYASAVLYGGLDYGNGTDYVAEATTRKGWNYLPGTLEEVTTIGNVLNRHKIKTETFTGQQGTEYSFVQLSGKKNSVIHLATHGFFYSVSSSRKETFFDKLRGGDLAQSEEISPMQRSGLLLSNGNKTWMSEKESEGSEDGVLLASEVMNMNLFGTSLLVLSACETGLGDMSVEGIMGLQRAFKLSGVETIVMSLWEVDDAATTMMMEQFYENLMSGKSKRKAFSLAQQKVRKKYPAEPQKWAVFIMLD